MSDFPNITQFRFTLMRLVSDAQSAGIDAALCGEVWTDAQAICRELQIARLGVRDSTLEQARQVARLDIELRALDPDERLGAIQDRLHVGRAKVFRLRKIARSLSKVETTFSVSI